MQNTKNAYYKHYIAIDWAKTETAIASLAGSSCDAKLKLIPSDVKLIKNYLKSFRGSKLLTIEETTSSHWLYVELKEYADKILVCDPYRNGLLKEGSKTDKIDARKLCFLLRSGMLKEVYHSLDSSYELRKLLSGYEDLIKASVRLKNQRSALKRSQGDYTKVKNKNIKGSNLSEIETFIISRQNLAIDYIGHLRKEYEDKFQELSSKIGIIKELMKISGIGLKIAVLIYARVIDASRFENKYKYWSYCGLVRHIRQSGGVRYGNKRARSSHDLKRAYKIAAFAAVEGKNDIREYYDVLLNKGYGLCEAKNQISRYIAKVSYAVMKYKTPYRAYQWRKSIN